MNKEIGKTLRKLKGEQVVMNKENKFEKALKNLEIEIERINSNKKNIKNRIQELKVKRRTIYNSNGITFVGFDLEEIENDNQDFNLTTINSKIEKLEFAFKQDVYKDEKFRLAAEEYIKAIEPRINDLEDKITHNVDEITELIETTELRKEEVRKECDDITIQMDELLFPLGESVMSYHSNYSGAYKINKLKEKVKC